MRNLSCLGLKLFSIYLFTKFITYILNSIGIISAIIAGDHNLPLLQILLISNPTLVYLVFSIILWLYSDSISRMIIKEDETVVFDSSFNFEKYEQVMYSVTGIIFIIIGIGGLGGNITNGIVNNLKNSYSIDLPNLIKNLIFIVLGTLLVFKTKGIILGIKKAFSSIEIK